MFPNDTNLTVFHRLVPTSPCLKASDFHPTPTTAQGKVHAIEKAQSHSETNAVRRSHWFVAS